MTKATGHLCAKHGGAKNGPDDFWLCDACARQGINLCSCGSPARYFGEALMCSVSCESCTEFVMLIGSSKKALQLWNEGVRGDQGYDGD